VDQHWVLCYCGHVGRFGAHIDPRLEVLLDKQPLGCESFDEAMPQVALTV
jgi:hypothetical protein